MFKLILAVLLWSCSHTPVKDPISEMNAIRAEFNEEFGIKDSKIVMGFGIEAFVEGVGGVCVPSRHLLLLNQDLWQYLGPYQKKQLIYHELGHCELNLEHVNARFENGAPVSFMFPSMQPFSEGFLEANWNYYVAEEHALAKSPAQRISH